MNKIEVSLVIVLIGILLYIGGVVYYEMTTEIENNPEIKDIGGPPVITDLRLVVVVVVVACIFCGIVLKMKPKEEKEVNDE